MSNINYSNLQENTSQIIGEVSNLQNTQNDLLANLEQEISQETTTQPDDSMSNIDYSNLQEGNSQIIQDISNLQNIEKDLFSTLEQSISQETITQTDKESMINKINEISQMRANLYDAIGGINSFYQNSLNSSEKTLAQQSAAVSIVENELNEAKTRMESIKDYKLKKLRLVEINNYYGARYAAHSNLMKIVLYMFVPILVLAILANYGILPGWLFTILVIIIGFIGVIALGYEIWSMTMRDNMIYPEYDWGFNPDTAPKAVSVSNYKDPWAASSSNVAICIGQQCCDTGYSYNSAQNKCIPSVTENFVSEIFTKYSKMCENKKPDYTMGDNLPVSYAST
jgi:hypothetical protein